MLGVRISRVLSISELSFFLQQKKEQEKERDQQ